MKKLRYSNNKRTAHIIESDTTNSIEQQNDQQNESLNNKQSKANQMIVEYDATYSMQQINDLKNDTQQKQHVEFYNQYQNFSQKRKLQLQHDSEFDLVQKKIKPISISNQNQALDFLGKIQEFCQTYNKNALNQVQVNKCQVFHDDTEKIILQIIQELKINANFQNISLKMIDYNNISMSTFQYAFSVLENKGSIIELDEVYRIHPDEITQCQKDQDKVKIKWMKLPNIDGIPVIQEDVNNYELNDLQKQQNKFIFEHESFNESQELKKSLKLFGCIEIEISQDIHNEHQNENKQIQILQSEDIMQIYPNIYFRQIL